VKASSCRSDRYPHTPFLHATPPLQKLLSQQAWPVAPQTSQVPAPPFALLHIVPGAVQKLPPPPPPPPPPPAQQG